MLLTDVNPWPVVITQPVNTVVIHLSDLSDLLPDAWLKTTPSIVGKSMKSASGKENFPNNIKPEFIEFGGVKPPVQFASR